MSDPFFLIRAALDRLQGEVVRLRTSLAEAEAEQAELETAWRVVERLCSASPSQSGERAENVIPSTVRVEPEMTLAQKPERLERRTAEQFARRRNDVRQTLGFGEEEGKTPSMIHAALVAKGITDIDVANVRTTVWRMAQTRTDVASSSGRYWRTDGDVASNASGSPHENGALDSSAISAPDAGEVAPSPTDNRAGFDALLG